MMNVWRKSWQRVRFLIPARRRVAFHAVLKELIGFVESSGDEKAQTLPPERSLSSFNIGYTSSWIRISQSSRILAFTSVNVDGPLFKIDLPPLEGFDLVAAHTHQVANLDFDEHQEVGVRFEGCDFMVGQDPPDLDFGI